MHASDEESLIRHAADILRAGGVVAFPTETVYGLGASATNPQAVRKIFTAKGRPPTNPLIVHITDERMARRYVTEWPTSAAKLARCFWPGPLTLVLPATTQIAREVSAGLSTIGLRAPNHPIAQSIIRAFDGPVAAPSANRSQRISPTTADHVRQELGDRVDLILDGGPCTVGIESTVIDLTADIPTILRPGGITQLQLQEVLGNVRFVARMRSDEEPAVSPGQQAIHYSPTKPTFRFDQGDVRCIERYLTSNSTNNLTLLALYNSPILPHLKAFGENVKIVLLPDDADQYARAFYSTLREADADALQTIWIELPPVADPWHALRDRITRASKPACELK